MKREGLILGIDPGTVITGWGIVQENGQGFTPIDFGCIRPKPSMKLTDRYLVIFEAVQELIETHALSALAIETQFVSDKNPQSAIKLGMARGVIVLAAKLKGIPVFEYAPTKIKLAVTGRGTASKGQVQRMIQQLLSLDSIPEPEDAADALACAICHGHTARFNLLLSGEI